MLSTTTVGIRQLSEDLLVSTKTIRRMVQTGSIPAPMRLNGKAYRWLQSEIRAWMELGMPKRCEFERLRNASKLNADKTAI